MIGGFTKIYTFLLFIIYYLLFGGLIINSLLNLSHPGFLEIQEMDLKFTHEFMYQRRKSWKAVSIMLHLQGWIYVKFDAHLNGGVFLKGSQFLVWKSWKVSHVTCARVDQLLILGMVIPPLRGHPYNGYTNPYYWVDDHPILHGNDGSIDPSTYIQDIALWFNKSLDVFFFRRLPISISDCRINSTAMWEAPEL